MKKYIVEITTNENYCTDNWDNDWNPEKYVYAKNAKEAVYRVMDYLYICGENTEKMLFRISEVDEYGCNGEWIFM